MVVYPVLHKGAVREEEACKGDKVDKGDKGEERARKRKRWSLLLQDTIP